MASYAYHAVANGRDTLTADTKGAIGAGMRKRSEVADLAFIRRYFEGRTETPRAAGWLNQESRTDRTRPDSIFFWACILARSPFA